MNDWDKILKDFARKCKGGAPDMTNPRHLALLRESLIKFGWNENATNEFVGNLREAKNPPTEIEKLKRMKKPWGKNGKLIMVSTALGYTSYKNYSSSRYQQSAHRMALAFLKKISQKDDAAGNAAKKILYDETPTGQQKPATVTKPSTGPTQFSEEDEQMITDRHGDIEDDIENAADEQAEDDILEEINNGESEAIDDGDYGPGGGPASFGEDRFCGATDDHINGNHLPKGKKEEESHAKHKQEMLTKKNKLKQREAYAREMGLLGPDEEYDDEKHGDAVAEEMANREVWAERKNKEVKTKKVFTAKSGLNGSHSKKMEWLRAAYDGGRSTSEDINSDDPDYGGPPDPDKPKPRSMIMSKSNQKAVRKMLDKRFQKANALCQLKNDKKACDDAEHYKEQLDTFDEGMEDHDTGMVYYDNEGKLRFVNISNKQAKSMKDPHKNNTAQSMIPAIEETMNEIRGTRPALSEEGAAAATQTIYTAMDDATEMSVEANSVVQDRVKEKKIDASSDPGIGHVLDRLPAKKDYQPKENKKGEAVGGKYIKDAREHKKTGEHLAENGIGLTPKRKKQYDAKKKELVDKQNECDKLKGKEKAECKKEVKKLKGEVLEFHKEASNGATDRQVAQAVLDMVKNAPPYPAHDPFGKLVLKMGQMWNKVNSRFDEIKKANPNKSDDQIYDQISEESRPKNKKGKPIGPPVYSPKELKAIKNSKELEKCGAIKDEHNTAMVRAHERVVEGCQDADKKYLKYLQNKKNKTPEEQEELDAMKRGENGPHVEGYIRTFMKGMHWDKYIDNLDGKKMINIGGYNLKPAEFRKCLADQSGFSDDNPEPENEPEKTKWREKLKDHLGKKIKIEADTNAVYMLSTKKGDIDTRETITDPDTGEEIKNPEYGKQRKIYLGEDTWRQAGDSKKIAGHIGDDMIKCIKGEYSKRKKKQKSKK
jgi:hypothetical protein